MSAFSYPLFNRFFRLLLPLYCTICLVRVYEYYAIASKTFTARPFLYELTGILYDIWMVSIYGGFLFLIFVLLHKLHLKAAIAAAHLLNLAVLTIYIALIITFSERNTPFDHEFFTRGGADTTATVKQMLTGGAHVYIPFLLYWLCYLVLSLKLFRRTQFHPKALAVLGITIPLSIVLFPFANPSPKWFPQSSAYYLTCNKLSYWIDDSYNYLRTNKEVKLTDQQLKKEISFYQQNQPFQFTSQEYPLLHKNEDNDVLGPFLNLHSTPPNIVILVVEGLSRDFSGNRAYAGSFTPFLDSLSNKSLVWDNFLSTAPGTFAAHPAISASLPYGKKGFSIMNVMPDHLSLIKILKANGYYTQFLVGFNPDFDNMGGFIRLQGTDFMLSKYGPKYKMMGIGEEGWTMGYPDDALFSRSFEVLDSIHKTPYLSIYHTGTTHMPYLFEQKALYEKKFDEKVKTMNVSAQIKKSLRGTKKVLTTFMFSDDCLRNFFAEYSKRPEYNNTIFLITGDHHIGSFPATCTIDDYHVPFIIYSPMLKKAQRFLSVNSHNNITPTLTNLLFHNYDLKYKPQEVHWLAGVMDTATEFRNIQSMAFMAWSRDINDYIYKDYFLSGNQLYKLTPDLLQEDVENDSIKTKMIRLRENFKHINNYVCDNNRVFPKEKNFLPGEKVLLWESNDPAEKTIFTHSDDTSLVKDFKVPEGYKYLYVECTANTFLNGDKVDEHPSLRFAMIDDKNWQRNYIYWSMREIYTLSRVPYVPQQWNEITANDLFDLDDYRKVKDLLFEVAVYSDELPINFKLKDMKVRVYGIKPQ